MERGFSTASIVGKACGGRRREILLREGIVGFIFVPWREKEKLLVPPRDRTRVREWFRRPGRDWNPVEAELAVLRLNSKSIPVSKKIKKTYFFLF